MERETYEKVYIQSEEDLPRHADFVNKGIVFHEKCPSRTRGEDGYSSSWDEYFINEVDWYFRPLPALTEEEIRRWVLSLNPYPEKPIEYTIKAMQSGEIHRWIEENKNSVK